MAFFCTKVEWMYLFFSKYRSQMCTNVYDKSNKKWRQLLTFFVCMKICGYPCRKCWNERREWLLCDMSMENMQTNQFDYHSYEIMWKSCFSYKSCMMCISNELPSTLPAAHHERTHIHTRTNLLDCHFRVYVYYIHAPRWYKRISDLSTTKHHIPCGNMSLIWYLFDLYEKSKWKTVQCQAKWAYACTQYDYMALHIHTGNLSHLMGYQIDFHSSKNICIWLC